jgi:hypothetical protein
MADSYYYHGTSLDHLISILESREIKCRRLLNEGPLKYKHKKYSGPGYNGLDYVSICKPNNESSDSYSAFNIFIVNHFCLIISDTVSAVKTITCAPFINQALGDEYNGLRYSDLKDEWQVKTRITLDNVVGIAIPFQRVDHNLYDLRKIKYLLQLAKDYDLPVIDSSFNIFDSTYNSNSLVQQMVNNHFISNTRIDKYLEYEHKTNLDKAKEKILSILQKH